MVVTDLYKQHGCCTENQWKEQLLKGKKQNKTKQKALIPSSGSTTSNHGILG